jgi:hypothetical protein
MLVSDLRCEPHLCLEIEYMIDLIFFQFLEEIIKIKYLQDVIFITYISTLIIIINKGGK